jgi:hypothetical protein
VTALATSTAILVGDGAPTPLRYALLVVAYGAFAAMFAGPARGVALSTRAVVVAAGVMLVTAVAVAPVGHDVWSYTFYGRMVAVHHTSPYTHVPADFPSDPIFRLVGWRRTPSVYGPVFVGIAAVATWVLGTGVTALRLFFQGIEAVALVVALVVVWRRSRDASAVAFLALNPAVYAAITDGHNDLLVGLALLGGALLLTDRRAALAGATLAAGALVKLVALLPFAALAVWAWWRFGVRTAVTFVTVGLGAVVLGYGSAGGISALEPVLHAAGARTSRASIWSLATLPARSGFVSAPVLVTAVLVGIVLLTVRDHVAATWLAGATVVLFLLSAQYVLPWYAAWGLPVLAIVWRSALAWIAMLQAALLNLAYVAARGTGGLSRIFYGAVVPAALVVAIVAVLAIARRDARRRVEPVPTRAT